MREDGGRLLLHYDEHERIQVKVASLIREVRSETTWGVRFRKNNPTGVRSDLLQTAVRTWNLPALIRLLVDVTRVCP